MQDLADVRAVVNMQRGHLDSAYLDAWLPVTERELLARVTELTDDELLQRLLGM